MTGRDRAVAALAGAGAGFFGGLFGVGGGIIMVPVLTGALRLTQHQAHATSLAVIVFTALAAGAVYAAHGNVAWTTGIVVGLVSATTAPLGAALAHRMSSVALTRAFSVLLVLVAFRLLWTPPVGGAHLHGTPVMLLVDLAIGAAAGLLAGFMGVGGGLIAVPAFTLVLGFPQQLAQGTSLLAILGAASSGAWAHSRRGAVQFRWVPWLALGAVTAGPLVSWAVQRLPQALLVRAFAVFLIANGATGWVRSGARRPA